MTPEQPEEIRVEQAVIRACVYLRKLARSDERHSWSDDDLAVLELLLDAVEDATMRGVRGEP